MSKSCESSICLRFWENPWEASQARTKDKPPTSYGVSLSKHNVAGICKGRTFRHVNIKWNNFRVLTWIPCWGCATATAIIQLGHLTTFPKDTWKQQVNVKGSIMVEIYMWQLWISANKGSVLKSPCSVLDRWFFIKTILKANSSISIMIFSRQRAAIEINLQYYSQTHSLCKNKSWKVTVQSEQEKITKIKP